jgi:hypothetical protein
MNHSSKETKSDEASRGLGDSGSSSAANSNVDRSLDRSFLFLFSTPLFIAQKALALNLKDFITLNSNQLKIKSNLLWYFGPTALDYGKSFESLRLA